MAKTKLKNVVVLDRRGDFVYGINKLEDALNIFYESGYRVVCSCGGSNEILILEKKW